MKLKQKIKKLNNEKGITGIDVVVALGIIIVAVTVISLIYVNVNLGNNSINRTAGATRLTTNILENIEKLSYDEFCNFLDNTDSIYNSQNQKSISYVITNLPQDSESTIEEIKNEDNEVIGKKYKVLGREFGTNKVFNTKIPSGYTLVFEVTNSYGTNSSNIKVDLVKNISISVMFKVGDREEDVSISTAKEREQVPECNAPDLSKKYLKEAHIENKKIIPIKFSSSYNGYVKCSETDTEWYNYFSKEWARILVINENKENLFFDSNSRVKKEIYDGSEKLDIEDYIYVWIPNFSIDDNFAYFRYGQTKNIIEQISIDIEVESEARKVYYNSVGAELNDYGNCHFNNIVGVWRAYNSSDNYYETFNGETQFGPLNLH